MTLTRHIQTMWMLLIGTLIITLAGCGDNGASSSGQTGTLRLRLTDAPGEFDEVNITFSEISANIDGEWITVEDAPQSIDLLQWNNGRSIELGRAEMPAGRYSQIRLIISSAEVIVAGTSHAMVVPSGAQTGLKLGPAFTIEPNLTFDLIVDFDAGRSVVQTGPPQSPNGYILQPRVRVIPVATSGAIAGSLTNPSNLPVAYAITAADTVTSSVVDTTGSFTLAFLPEGTYTVAVVDTLNSQTVQNEVVVQTGITTQLTDVTLP